MNKTNLISEHIKLLQELKFTPNTVMINLLTYYNDYYNKNFTWENVRTALERRQIQRSSDEYSDKLKDSLNSHTDQIAIDAAELVATEGVKMRLNKDGEEVVRDFKLADINIRIDDDG